MNKYNDILDKLTEYGRSEFYPFHMPGHKRQMDELVGINFPNAFDIDITEIEGFDNLHHAEGLLRESMEWAAMYYGADKTYYLVNGSSGGILSAISGIVPFGGTLLMSRNCHKSVYHGVILNHLKTIYVYPQIIPDFGLQGGLSAGEIRNLLITYKNIDTVLIVSPTYDGVVSDIEGIANVVHEFGIPLIVDEAHGAHFAFGNGFPESALSRGADVVIQSLHKTLPSLTQTALLHVKSGFVDVEKIEKYLSVYQTSSPSYVFMASIDRCIRWMNAEGRHNIEEFGKRLDAFRKRLFGMSHLRLLDRTSIGFHDVFDLDPSKIVISCRNTNLNGAQLNDCLRTNYHLEMEMCGADYVTAITTLADGEQGMNRLLTALLDIDHSCAQLCSGNHRNCMDLHAKARMDLWEGFGSRQEGMDLLLCEGRISGEFVYLYPPGIPILAPGEVISGEILEVIMKYQAMGLSVQGMRDKSGKRLQIVLENMEAGE